MPQANLFLPNKNFSNKLVPAQCGQQFDQWVSWRHGAWYASVYGTPVGSTAGQRAGAAYYGSNQTGATISAALATTYTGLCLSNPAGSTVNLVIHEVVGTFPVAPAGLLAIGLITGWSAAGVVTHTTPLNTSIAQGYVGAATSGGSIVGPASAANLDAACTLVGTPVWTRWLAGNSASTNSPNFSMNMQDSIIIPPGGYAAIGGNVGGPTAGLFGTFFWDEVAP